jgi:hypothetical protein
MSGPRPDKAARADRDDRLARARAAAAELVRRLGLTAPTDLVIEDIAEALGAEIVIGPLPNALAQVVRIGAAARIRISDRIEHEGRRRFSIAHELGHLWLGHEARSFAELCSAIAIEGMPVRMEEAESNAFASELRMPAAMLMSWATLGPPTVETAREVADAFRVSLTAAALRLIELSPYACALTICRRGRIRRVARSVGFPFFLPHDRIPGSESGVVERVAWGRVPRGPRRVAATTWLGCDADPALSLVEDAVAVMDGDVLTILLTDNATDPLAGR